MIDSHAHLHDPAFDADRAEVFARAHAAGVQNFILIGTDIADSGRAIDVANDFGAGVAIGIHPHEAENAPGDLTATFAALRQKAQRLVAIGEIGLDYHYEHSPREIQRAVLLKQLRIAGEYHLPVIFHEREALDDFVEVLRFEGARRERENIAPLRGVIHCFTRDEQAARIYTEEFDLFLGIGGVLTFKTAEALRAAVGAVGPSKLILETDCPYLAPIPHRGKRNEPAFMAQSAEKLAEVLALSPSAVYAQTTANCVDLFGAF